MANVWIIYDGRADFGDTDEATVLEACSSKRDLRSALFSWRGHDAVVYEYEVADGDMLVNERKLGHVSEYRKVILGRCSPQTQEVKE